MDREDRLKNSIEKKCVKDEYFLLYYIGKNDAGDDMYGIEVMGENVLSNMIKNIDNGTDDEIYDKSKTSIGKVYKYENEILKSINKHYFEYRVENRKLSELIRYSYIGESYRYSSRNRSYRRSEDGYIANRRLVSNPSMYKKYLTINKCKNGEIRGFECNSVKMKFYDDIDYSGYYINDDKRENYKKYIERIENKLYLRKRIHLNRNNEKENLDNKTEKEKYICDLYTRYIMDMIVNGLYSRCKDDNVINEQHIEEKVTNEDILYIYGLNSIDSSINKFGLPENYKLELNKIEEIIDKVKYRETKDIEVLKIISRYIASRINTIPSIGGFAYVEALEKIVESLQQIPEEYFNKDGVEVIIDEKQNSSIINLLNNYSYFIDARQNEVDSDIGYKFIIRFEMLSEGEEKFLDIIAKIDDCIENNNDAELIVLLLDEPDQALHPEWSRRFIDIIVQVIQSIKFQGNIQLIMSTHSPYLLSDILPTNVFLLDRRTKDKKLSVKRLDVKSSSLGANIYDLMKNNFFMDNTVGEFITKKINKVIMQINEANLKENELNSIEYFIEQIGEPIIRRGMKKQLAEKKKQLKIFNNTEQILQAITNKQDRKKVEEVLKNLAKKENDTY